MINCSLIPPQVEDSKRRCNVKVFLIGGAGFLGVHLVPKLISHGHDVTVLTRSKEKASRFDAAGVRGIVGDLLQPESFMSQLSPQDVVVSIAKPDIRPGRISKKRMKILQAQAATCFATAITTAKHFECPLFLTLGTSFHTKGDEVADESWEIERFGMTNIGELVDPLISEVIKQGSPPLIQMLPGEIYGPGGLFRNVMYEWLKTGRFRVIGSGENYIPRIHVDDCAEAYVLALEKMPLGEKFILADDGPCTSREFADYMADCMNVTRPKLLPSFIIRIVMGKLICETITMNCRVSNANAKRVLGWRPRYPTYQEGLPATIEAIKREKQ
jgi:nucleoside-diphosphate-sugar epimerase